ncbi:MAG: hypothetical protein D6737_00600, partial [Chloroflexi bacterium]
LDIDGVISDGEAQRFDLRLLQRLADLNRRAQHDTAVPAVTLNTGRPSAYVEAMMQAIDGWRPALFESGAGLYFPTTYQFTTSPLLSSQQMTSLQAIVRRIDDEIVQRERAYWQPGKSVCYTLFAKNATTLDDLVDDVRRLVTQMSDQFMVDTAVEAVNIHPAHIHKGTGLQWLADVTGIALSAMGGVGDSPADVNFLALVGRPAAPANAADAVKQVAEYVSSQATASGLQDILDYWGV